MKKVTLQSVFLFFCLSAFSQTGEFAYYSFGGNTNDNSGNGRHGTNFNVTFTADRFGYPNSAAMFDGNSAYVSLPFKSVQFVNSISIAAWVYRTKTSGNYDVQGIVSNDLSTDRGIVLGAVPNTNKFIVSIVNTQNTQATFESLIIPENTWHFVTMTYDGSQVKTYEDGVFVSSSPFSGSIRGDQFFSIGRDTYYQASGRYWGGKIDDVRFYDFALSQGEIQNLYNVTTGLLDDSSDEIFEIFPNPIVEYLTIKTTCSKFNVVLTNLQGQMIKEIEGNGPTITINLTDISRGIYLLQFHSQKSFIVKKIIKN
jgi:hypothetical protein